MSRTANQTRGRLTLGYILGVVVVSLLVAKGCDSLQSSAGHAVRQLHGVEQQAQQAQSQWERERPRIEKLNQEAEQSERQAQHLVRPTSCPPDESPVTEPDGHVRCLP